tara:strand:+ start:938 stop:1765 length:828 start_codon:yes stop_codon:yes gene_type:complete
MPPEDNTDHSADNLFSGQTGNSNDDSSFDYIDPDKNYFEELVGENKKYRDEKALARAALEKDQFIERLKKETKGLREDLTKSTSLDSFLEKLEASNGTNNRESGREGDPTIDTSSQKTQFSQQDLEELVSKKVAETERMRVRAENVTQVKQSLVEMFGAEYTSHVDQIGKSLGMSRDDLDSLASDKPKAFLKLVQASGVEQQQQTNTRTEQNLFTPPTGRATNQSPAGNDSVKRTQNWYDKLKAVDQKKYWSPQVQNQMHQDAIQMGPSFFDSQK